MRKPFGRLRPGKTQTGPHSASEASYSLESLDIASRSIILSKQRTTKTQISLRIKDADQTADTQADLRLCCSHIA